MDENPGVLPGEAHAFCVGEDYELLFTLSAETNRQEFESKWEAQFPELKLSRIGTISEADPQGIYIDEATSKALNWQFGFEHFHRL